MLIDSSYIIVRKLLIKDSVKRGGRCQLIHRSFLEERELLKMECAKIILYVKCLPLNDGNMYFHGDRKDHSGN